MIAVVANGACHDFELNAIDPVGAHCGHEILDPDGDVAVIKRNGNSIDPIVRSFLVRTRGILIEPVVDAVVGANNPVHIE